jgi:hypothetical protein
MTTTVAVTTPPHDYPGRIHIGTSEKYVDDMPKLAVPSIVFDAFTPAVAAKVEDILISKGYAVTSEWEYCIDYYSAQITPLGGGKDGR